MYYVTQHVTQYFFTSPYLKPSVVWLYDEVNLVNRIFRNSSTYWFTTSRLTLLNVVTVYFIVLSTNSRVCMNSMLLCALFFS